MFIESLKSYLGIPELHRERAIEDSLRIKRPSLSGSQKIEEDRN
jgi:hypothetical protein